MAPLVRTGGSRHTGLAALPHRNIHIDCDGQDDINAMDQMVDVYLDGCDIVYGVRSNRATDTFFKRFTAETFYKLLRVMV